MLAKKYSAFRREVKKYLGDLKTKKIQESEFDEFIENVLSARFWARLKLPTL